MVWEIKLIDSFTQIASEQWSNIISLFLERERERQKEGEGEKERGKKER